MNYFYSENQVKTYQKFVNDPLFPSLIDYLYAHREEEVILRELKKEFPQKDFEHFLDQLIENGLILRKARRYRLNFPVFEPNDYQEYSRALTEKIASELESLTEIDRKFAMSEEIWTYCFEEEAEYFYAAANDRQVRKMTAGNSTYRFVSLSSDEELPLSLAVYFFIQKNQLPIPSKFSEIAELIGDVNEAYYFDQVEVIIERIRKGKFKNRRPSIFLESLLATRTVEKTTQESDAYELVLPIVSEEREPLDIIKCTDGIDLPTDAAAFIKKQAYNELKSRFMPKSFSYIKKMLDNE